MLLLRNIRKKDKNQPPSNTPHIKPKNSLGGGAILIKYMSIKWTPSRKASLNPPRGINN